MRRLHLSIRIEKPFAGIVGRRFLREVVELTLASAGMNSAVELGLVIAGDGTVHELNRSYRSVDRTTDVISFALTETSDREVEGFIMPPDDVRHLGDVVISYPQAKRQAREHRHPVEHELALLLAHGVLHLLRYDHQCNHDEKIMKALERKTIRAWKAKN